MERAEVNCPVALRQLGVTAHLEGRHAEAVKYLKRSVDFGDIDANYQIAVMYAAGRGVEKDDKKRITHMKTAAIGGHPGARLDLAPIEIRNNGRTELSNTWSSLQNLEMKQGSRE